MSAFLRARPVGRWLDGTTITEPELELWDGNIEKAINAYRGGVWDPVARIVIGGAGVRIAGPSDLQDVRQVVMTNGAVVTYSLPGEPVTRCIPIDGAVARRVSSLNIPGWKLEAASGVRPVWVSHRLGAPLVLRYRLPIGTVITSMSVTLGVDASITHLNPPDAPSLVEIIRQPGRSVAQTGDVIPSLTLETLASARDVFVDDATYKAPHEVVVTPEEPIVVDPAYRYSMRIHSEDGTTGNPAPEDNNAHLGQYFIACRLSTLQTKIDPIRA